MEDGKALGAIILPEKTELELLIEKTYQGLLKEHPGESGDTLRKEARKIIENKWNANQVGGGIPLQDEELLAANELQEFIKKISGATLRYKEHLPITSHHLRHC